MPQNRMGRREWSFFVHSLFGVFLLDIVMYARKVERADAGTETNINLYHELYYHHLGTNQSEDILCWKDLEHPERLSSAKITDDGQVALCFSLATRLLLVRTPFKAIEQALLMFSSVFEQILLASFDMCCMGQWV